PNASTSHAETFMKSLPVLPTTPDRESLSPVRARPRVRQKSRGTLLREGNLSLLDSSAVRERTPRWRPNPKGRIVLFQPRVGYMDSMRSKPALPLSLLHAVALAIDRFDV